MYYINSTPNKSDNYGNPMGNSFPGCVNLPDDLLPPYIEARGFVSITMDGNTVKTVQTNQDALDAYLAANPEPDTLAEAKAQRIAQSKTDLAAYLETHPLAWTDGQAYAITAEKQAQLTGKLMATTMAQSLSQPYDLTWNSTGEICKSWTLEDLSTLAFAIDARVTTLVTYQQTQEVAMRDAKDLDELNSIVIDYDTVQ